MTEVAIEGGKIELFHSNHLLIRRALFSREIVARNGCASSHLYPPPLHVS